MQSVTENGDPPSGKQNEEKTYKKVRSYLQFYFMYKNIFPVRNNLTANIYACVTYLVHF